MNPTSIDYIYYHATTSDEIGATNYIDGYIFIPFFDYLLVLSVFAFTILAVWFSFYLLYPRKNKIKVKNDIYLKIKKKDIKNLWN